MPLAVGTRLGPYEILAPLGAGGMGEVYRARDPRLEREVALKVLPAAKLGDETARKRMLREARLAASLNHPNVCTVHEVGEAEGHTYIAMELVPGQTLGTRLGSGRLAVDEALHLGQQMAEALAHAHERNLVHRDFKSGNVIVTAEGRAKVLDFGLAKQLTGEEVDTAATTQAPASLTQPGVVIGTLAYMAPEQLRGQAADARSDIWALGVVLYEMMSGRRPFQGQTGFALSSAILNEPVPALPAGVPQGLRGVIERCLEKEPARRYQRAAEIRAALETIRAAPAAASAVARHGLTRLRWPWAAVAAAVLLAGLAGSSVSRLRERFRPAPTIAGPTTLAILPLRTINAKDEIGYLGLGIADTIITQLANIGKLRVRPTNSILRYQDREADVGEVGKALNVESVLTGTIQRVEGRLRISVQLIRVADTASLWGQHYDLAQQDLLGLQDAIAEKVTAALELQVTAVERERVYRRYTQNPTAYDFYLRGRASLVRPTYATEEQIGAAVDSFEHALRLDPDYALARAGLATASARTYNSLAADEDRSRWADRAQQEVAAALRVDPNLAEAYEALGVVYGHTDFEWVKSIEASRRALELNPSLEHPHRTIAGAYLHLGLLDLVEREREAAEEANPLSPADLRRSSEAGEALLSGRYADAVRLYEEVRSVRGPDVLRDWFLAQAHYYNGERELAERMLAGLRRSGEPDVRAQATLASFLAARGERRRAEDLLRLAMARPSFEHHAAYSAGVTYAQLGQPAEAVRWLRRARDTGWLCYPWYARDPLLQPVQQVGEFREFMEDFRKSWESLHARYAR